MLPQNIERIVSFGGSISIDATKFLQSNLERFAGFAASSGATITLRKSNLLLQSNLERLAAFGKGRIIFEFD